VRRKEQDGQFGLHLKRSPQQLQPIHPRHFEIEYRCIRPPGADTSQPLLRFALAGRVVTHRVKGLDECLKEGLIIVDD
jgi:hypothetical protein